MKTAQKPRLFSRNDWTEAIKIRAMLTLTFWSPFLAFDRNACLGRRLAQRPQFGLAHRRHCPRIVFGQWRTAHKLER
jgi:hypothetical protein